jgi:pimeloyl-ACP methyl ester carboxylesterase
MSPHVMAAALLVASLSTPAFAQDRFFDSNGVRIRYVDQGEGEAVVLVHGFLGNIESNWVDTGIMPKLAAHYHVIALDERGHGRSGKPYDAKAYGREMAADVIRLMDHLHVNQAHIVGYSLGGRISALAVALHPERFLTATFGGSTPVYAGLPGGSTRSGDQVEKEVEEYRNGSARSLILRISPLGEPPPSEAEIAKRSAVLLAGQDPLAIIAARRSFDDFILTKEQAASIHVPTLLVVGSADPAIAAVKDY